MVWRTCQVESPVQDFPRPLQTVKLQSLLTSFLMAARRNIYWTQPITGI